MIQFFKKSIVFLLTLEARLVLRKYKPHIIAVTGSVGKTSTKDAIYAVVAEHAYARKSEKSFNSEIGIPLTILGCPNAWKNPLQWIQNLFDGLILILFTTRYPEWLVLEVGADRPGDIRSLASWLAVDVAVITRLPEVPVHVEYFASPEAVVEEKASLINALVQGGTLVLYGDDVRVRALGYRAPHARVLSFGFDEGVEVRGMKPHIVYESGVEKWPLGMQMDVMVRGTSIPVSVFGTLGNHALMPALAAVAVGEALSNPLPVIAQSIQKYQPPIGRMHLIAGKKNSLVIDDTYNSSPAATTAALETLKTIKMKGRKIAVLADMLELGRLSVEEHRKIGAVAAKAADLLLTVGFRARDIAQGALDAGMSEDAIFQYEDATRAAQELARALETGDAVLVKGSQSMRMEQVSKELMQDPERASELLVRQDEEWQKR